MNPGRLDRKITLREFSSSVGTTGQPLKTWSDLATVWAQKTDKAGGESERGGEMVATQNTIFKIRYLSTVSPKNRVSYDSVEYDIEFIKELGRKELLELHTKRRAD
tara:strand:+ start:496 stop:813 length:318 start_codon:yes stop_codon:yes gene_type:complete